VRDGVRGRQRALVQSSRGQKNALTCEFDIYFSIADSSRPVS
jgi:hypothetical protein